ncbi:MAG: helix-turn-helix transcriptional regulator [Methylococcus sp.]
MEPTTKRRPGRPAKVDTAAADLQRVNIPPELIHFDSLPDSAHVRLPVVKGLLGCSGSTIWRGVRKGTFPPPKKLSEAITAWNVGELRKALEARSAS